MYPLDGSSPDDFSGVDFAAYVCAAPIYDERKLEDQVAKVVEDFFDLRALPTRRCGVGGIGATAGGPFMDVYMWVQENWESMQKLASALIGFAVGVSTKWKTFKRGLNNKVLDRHVPSIVLEIGARIDVRDPSSTAENSRSFSSLLTLVPALDEALRKQLPDHKFSVRVLDLSGQRAARNALFKVECVTDSDIVRVLRYFQKIEHEPDSHTVLLHRQFGLITRLRPARGLSESTSLMLGTNP